MTKEEINIYKMRITQAGVLELTLIMLEMEMQWMEEAMEAFDKQEGEQYEDCVTKAQSTQLELMNVLNVNNAVALDVYSVFVYINKKLIESKIRKKPQELERCVKMLSKFYHSFQAIASTDVAGPVMRQSEKIYAGLTYGTHGLIENSIGGHEYS